MRKLFTYVALLLLSTLITAQTDNEFWFAAPDVSSTHGDPPDNGAPIYLHLTAVHPTTVTISKPADPSFTPLVYALDELEHQTIWLNDILTFDEIETYPQPLPFVAGTNEKQKKGFKITSDPGEITCYYELDNKYNRDIFPLKGRNALGQNFWVSTQNQWDNGDYSGTAWSGFIVVATQDNTTITVYQNDDWLYHTSAPSVITVNLNEGETYAFRAESTDKSRHINGVYVESDKDIAITIYDDSMRKVRSGGGKSYDIFGDQIVPVDIIGNEYIIMKGFIDDVPADDGGEKIYITATQNATSIYIDGNPVPVATIDAGQMFHYEITNDYVHVRTSKPAYVNHCTGFGGELGGAVLPTIEGCTGSYDVTFTRTPNTADKFYMNIMVRNDTVDGSSTKNEAVNHFTILSNGVTSSIPSNFFEYIMDSAYAVLKKDAGTVAWVADKIKSGHEALVQNDIAKYHLGVINGANSTGCKYGYFSDYSVSDGAAGIGGAYGEIMDVYCNLDPIRLVAQGGIGYEWWCHSHPEKTELLSDTTISDPYFFPDTAGNYTFRVKIIGECFTDTTIQLLCVIRYKPTAQFNVDVKEGCSPLTVELTHYVDTLKAYSIEWYLDNSSVPNIDQDTMPNPFNLALPENVSDTIRDYNIRLITKAYINACADSREKTVKIKPGVKAAFEVSDSMGCHPFTVNYNNLSTGHLDANSYFWEFGDGTQSYDSLPSNVFQNYSSDTDTSITKLVVTSPFDCNDSTYHNIYTHPYINGNYTIDTVLACSPLISNLNPSTSIGVDTLSWTLTYPSGIVNYKTESDTAIKINYTDTSQVNGPDTIFVNLTVQNRMGCSDVLPQRYLVAYPVVEADFDIDPTEICDSTPVQFTNNSIGTSLMYEWDFDDGTSFLDTTGNQMSHVFFNRTNNDIDYLVNLTATSDYFCSDTAIRNLTVHPYLNAFFTLEYENNCTPLDLIIHNQCTRVSNYNWSFGDGSPNSNSSNDTLYHQYSNPLISSDTTYRLKLVATNAEGCKDSIQKNVTLFPPIVSAFDMDVDEGCNPLTINFSNNSTGKDLIYNWQFGPITSATSAPTFSRTFSHPSSNDSTFNVILTVSNQYGCDSVLSKPVTVYSYVNANFSVARADSCSPFSIDITNTSSAGSTIYDWDFGDGDNSTAFEPNHTYSNTGLFLETDTLRLITSNIHNCYDTLKKVIQVYPEITAGFTASTLAGCQPLKVNFANNTNIIPGTSFVWDFDDGTYANQTVPSTHNYTNILSTSVIRNVQLSAMSQYGCTDTVIQQIEIYPYILAKYTLDKPEICSDETFQIDRSSSSGGIDQYLWDYDNDGSTDEIKSDALFSHTYTNTTDSTETKQILLTVTNTQGCDTTWLSSIKVHPAVTADFTIDNKSVCYPYNSLLTNTSQNKGIVATNFIWNFGDGTTSTSTANTINHKFNNFDFTLDRNYSISLYASSDFGCNNTHYDTITIHAKPKADFSFPVTVDCPPFSVPFTNNSIGNGLSSNWDFGNGNTSTDIEPTELFTNTSSTIKNYNVQLIVNSTDNCSDTTSQTLRVYPGVDVDFTASAWNGCGPLTVTFDGEAINNNLVEWYADGNIFSTIENPTYRLENNTGSNKTVDIRFVARSLNNCSADTVKQVVIYPTPIAEFMPNPSLQYYDTVDDLTEFDFSNITANQSSFGYNWDFGDGNTSTSENAITSHTYGNGFWGVASNSYAIPVALYAYNKTNTECNDSVNHDIYIVPPPPQIDIGEDEENCIPFTVDFSSTVKYTDGTYSWDFGYEDNTSSDPNPSFTYTKPGTYLVSMSVKGDGGNRADFKEITVYPKPEVDFTFDPKFALVASQSETGQGIKFYNNTQLAETYEWYFDDGNYSTEFEPIHEYTDTGTYYVTLIAASENSCLDTLQHSTPIVIEGTRLLEFPNVFVVNPNYEADENYDPNEPNIHVFRPVARGIKNYKLEIYNRWGELIFKTKDVNVGWTGYKEGQIMEQDVYIWRVTATFTDGKPYVAAGDVTLIVSPDDD